MIEYVEVRNFRSIESCEIPLGPITVLFGQTAGGKSSLLYALLCFRNFLVNPNQAADGIFNLGFQNLGGFEACVFNHETTREIVVGVRYRTERGNGKYSFRLTKSTVDLMLSAEGLEMRTGDLAMPFSLVQVFTSTHGEGEGELNVAWNGITSTVTPKTPTADTQAKAQDLAVKLNTSGEIVRRVDIAPHRRGFFKPTYTTVPLSQTPTNDDEVASLIISDMNLAPRVSTCTEEIFGRDFRLYQSPGTAVVYFQTTDKKAKMPVLLVNDGFGVNQAVYLLAKILRTDVDVVLIEEPEIHLHPTIIRQLARVLCSIAKDEGKQLIFTTHSEQFLVSILTCVKEGLISADSVCCYHLTREKKSTIFHPQQVKTNGQIEGGLSSFVEAETEDLRKFLGLQR